LGHRGVLGRWAFSYGRGTSCWFSEDSSGTANVINTLEIRGTWHSRRLSVRDKLQTVVCPYTLHPTPYTLHHKPCTLHPTLVQRVESHAQRCVSRGLPAAMEWSKLLPDVPSRLHPCYGCSRVVDSGPLVRSHEETIFFIMGPTQSRIPPSILYSTKKWLTSSERHSSFHCRPKS